MKRRLIPHQKPRTGPSPATPTLSPADCERIDQTLRGGKYDSGDDQARIDLATRIAHGHPGGDAMNAGPILEDPSAATVAHQQAARPSPQSCPDCARVGLYKGRFCLNCGRELDGRPSRVADRAERHIHKLERLGLPTKGHGSGCITRTTGGWAAPDEHPNHTRQSCPCCGRSEHRGSYCSGCGIPTGAADWHPASRSEAQQAVTRQKLAACGENGPRRDETRQDVTLSVWLAAAA
jgi:hypothetical protein